MTSADDSVEAAGATTRRCAKLRGARAFADAHMSEFCCDVYDNMLMMVEQKDVWPKSVLFVTTPHAAVQRVPSGKVFDAAIKARDAALAAGEPGGARQRSAARVAELAASFCVWARIRGPRGKEFDYMGYSVAPDASELTNIEHFRPLSSKYLPRLHDKTFNPRAHLHDTAAAPLRQISVAGGKTYNFIPFDPRHVVANWTHNFKLPAAAAPPTAAEVSEDADADAALPSKPPAPVQARRPAAAKKPSARAAVRRAAFVEKERRGAAARAELTTHLARGDAVRAFAGPPLAPDERTGLQQFPDSFAVDLDTLAHDKVAAVTGAWKTLPLCQVLLVAAQPDRYAAHPFVRWMRRTDAALRSDTLPTVVAAWKSDPIDATWERTMHAAEVRVAAQTVNGLAACGSSVFARARPFIAAAELTERVARIRSLPTGPEEGSGFATCALTGEPIAPGTPCHAFDLILSEAPLALTEDATAPVSRADTEPLPLPHAVTLVVKVRTDGSWPLVPERVDPAATDAMDIDGDTDNVAPPLPVATTKRKRAPAKRKRAASNADAAAAVATTPPAKRAKVEQPHRHALLDAVGLAFAPPPAGYATLLSRIDNVDDALDFDAEDVTQLSNALLTLICVANRDELRARLPTVLPLPDQRLYLLDLAAALFVAADKDGDDDGQIVNDDDEDLAALLSPVATSAWVAPLVRSFAALPALKEFGEKLARPSSAKLRTHPPLAETLAATTPLDPGLVRVFAALARIVRFQHDAAAA